MLLLQHKTLTAAPARSNSTLRPASRHSRFWKWRPQLGTRGTSILLNNALLTDTSDRAEPCHGPPTSDVSGYLRLPCSVNFSTRRDVSRQMLSMTLFPCCPYQARRSVSPHQSLRPSMLPSPENGRLGLRVSVISGPYGFTALRPGDSLAILVDGFVNRLQDAQFPSFLLFKLRGLDSYPGRTCTH